LEALKGDGKVDIDDGAYIRPLRKSDCSTLRTWQADPEIAEDVKWKRPSNPMGVAVWEHNGMVCLGAILKEGLFGAEEKERGMTIDLGFAWLKLPSGLEVSIVDVPGVPGDNHLVLRKSLHSVFVLMVFLDV
jgi:hypothetical protein